MKVKALVISGQLVLALSFALTTAMALPNTKTIGDEIAAQLDRNNIRTIAFVGFINPPSQHVSGFLNRPFGDPYDLKRRAIVQDRVVSFLTQLSNYKYEVIESDTSYSVRTFRETSKALRNLGVDAMVVGQIHSIESCGPGGFTHISNIHLRFVDTKKGRIIWAGSLSFRL